MQAFAESGGNLQMILALGLLGLALLLYLTEWLAVEVVSVGMLAMQLLAFTVLPVKGPDGANLLSPDALLAGFGNPALITVMALLVMAEALTRTGALDMLVSAIGRLKLSRHSTAVVTLAAVGTISGFISDTVVVVMFLPVMQALAIRLGMAPSRVMMPLSFASVLGGMTTLIGSSTNLLVSSVLVSLGEGALGFFEQTRIGLPCALVGALYLLFVMPRLLPVRGGLPMQQVGQGKQFISQLIVPAGSPLVGARAVAGQFRQLPDITVHLIVRDDSPEFPPFDEIELRPGDVLMLAGTRKALAEAEVRFPGLLTAPPPAVDEDEAEDAEEAPRPPRERGSDYGEEVLVEAMVTPTSSFTGFTLDQIGLVSDHTLTVVGIERRARMMRGPMARIRLQAGDVLLLKGRWADIDQLREDRDLVVVSGTSADLPKPFHARRALAIFVVAIGLAAFNILPIVVAALIASTLLVVTGALSPRQAIRAIDYRVVLLVGNTLALGQALHVTGAAAWLAGGMVNMLGGSEPLVILSAYFGLVALGTNVLSHNACALLFTPIGVQMGHLLGMDPHLFAVATVLGANMAFGSPIGHQTNVLVMAPGHYRFIDYVKAGLPLVVLLWAVFIVSARVVWGI